VRRGFFDFHKSTGSIIAREALERIGTLFDIERTIAGQSAERRREVRQVLAREKLDQLAQWLDVQLTLIPGNF
jgi:transposase